jgi:hypothetical protein
MNGHFEPRRALLEFDVESVIPAGSQITAVRLVLNMNRTIAGPTDMTLHLVTQEWGQGTSTPSGGGGGSGGPAATDDATWLHTFFNTATWTTPGGDFVAGASATNTVDQSGVYTWASTAQLVADVQGWIDTPGSNHGWILIGDESASPTAKRFGSNEAIAGQARPRLTVDYTPATDVEPLPGIRALRLDPAHPNPFNPRTSLAYVLPAAGRVQLTLHDARGALIATLVDRVEDAGSHHASWDGRDLHGRNVASGVYIVRLASPSGTRTQSVVLAK